MSETEKLKREIERLKKENARLSSINGQKKILYQNIRTHEYRGYFSYLKSMAKRHSVYRLFEITKKFFSKFRIITLVLKISMFVVIAIQTSAVIFLAAILFIALIPTLLIFASFSFIYSSARSKKDAEHLQSHIGNKKIIVYFISKDLLPQKHSFLSQCLAQLESQGYFIITVSPFILSPFGIFEKSKPYSNQRYEKNGIFTIRTMFFFFIKKRLLEKHNKRVIYIY